MSVPKNARKEYQKGVNAIEKGDLPGGRGHLEKAVGEYACFARAQTALGWVLIKMHDFPGAEAALKKAIECDPGHQNAYVELAELFNGQELYAESEKVLHEAERHFPSAWQIDYQLALAHLGLKQYTKAQEEFLKVLSINPSPPPEFYVKFADLYSTVDEYDKAYAQMQAYLRADPNGRFAPKIKMIMQKMESMGVLHTLPARVGPPPPK